MKARIKATGQIIDVYLSNINDSTSLNYYAEKGTSKAGLNEYSEKELDFNDVIDWEQRRYEIAKDFYTHNEGYSSDQCVRYADDLIEALKAIPMNKSNN